MRYCLDASFLLDSLIPHSVNPAVDARMLSLATQDELISPSILLAECTSVLNREVHLGRVNQSRARVALEGMLQLPIRIVEHPQLYPRVFDIARALGWAKAYDALYLAAAEHEDAELLTVDGGMHDAAVRLGIRATLVR